MLGKTFYAISVRIKPAQDNSYLTFKVLKINLESDSGLHVHVYLLYCYILKG